MLSIACALGMATCLNFQGHSFSKQEALRIYDDCGELASLPAYSFIQHQPKSGSASDIRQAMATSWGASYGRDIEDQGLPLKWPSLARHASAYGLLPARALSEPSMTHQVGRSDIDPDGYSGHS